jgi:3-oxoacyl-[acyl-carrier protein] reductase
MASGLDGKVALITGAARGLGRATALALARDGADIVLSYRQSDPSALVADIQALGRRALAIQGDVGEFADMERTAKAAYDEFGRIDILVAAAGIYLQGRIGDMRPEDWQETVRTNLTGTFNVTHAVLPYMRQQHSGAIVCFSSFAVHLPSNTGAVYAATKAAISSFTRVLAAEEAPYGIRANAVAPGVIATDMNAAMRAAAGDELRQQIALGRFGEPSEVAVVVAFLVSDRASYVTGSTWNVDGGKFATQVPSSAWEVAARERGQE